MCGHGLFALASRSSIVDIIITMMYNNRKEQIYLQHTMYIQSRISSLCILAAACLAAFLTIPGAAHADESASYSMQQIGPMHAAGTMNESESYKLTGDLSWRQESPLTGQTFQIVSGATSSDASSSSAATSSEDGGTGGTNGGGDVPPRRSSSRSSIPASSSPSSVISSVSSSHSSAASESLSSASVSDSASSLPLRPAAPDETPADDAANQCLTILCIGPFGRPVDLTPAGSGTVIVSTETGSTTPIRDALFETLGSCAESPLWIILIVLAFLLGVLTAAVLIMLRMGTLSQKRHRRMQSWLVLGLILAAILLMLQSASAAVSSPQKHVYNGRLLGSSGQAVTTAVSIRFSEWYSRDAVAGDTTGAGAINTAASTYAGWNEVHAVTPDSNGYFSVVLGESAALPDLSTMDPLDLDNLFLQVEVKAAAAADTSYELLDVNPSDDTIDRSPILSLPFAQNADLLDQREIGTGSGSIPLLGSGGRLPVAMGPGGTTVQTFVIDANNLATSAITLQFGTTLAKTLSYDTVNARFVFNDDVRIEGDLTVTGLINGIDISNLAGGSDSQLKVSSGAGLTINIAGGSYRLNGDATDYTGDSGVAVTANQTHYVFIGSGGLTVRLMPFPTDESFIRLAEVVTDGSSVTLVRDRRIVQADDREQTTEVFYNAEYPHTSYQADGSDNVGQLSVLNDGATLKNHYRWTSTRPTLQDYDALVRIALPSDFVRWSAAPLALTYRTTTADSADNQVDISVTDTAGSAVTLGGSATDLASTSWTTTNLTFSGTPTWTAGQEFLIRVKLSANDSNTADIAALKLSYVRLTPQ